MTEGSSRSPRKAEHAAALKEKAFLRLQEQLDEYASLPTNEIGLLGVEKSVSHIPERFRRPLKSGANQHRFPKEVSGRVDWQPTIPSRLGAGPSGARVGSTLTRLGSAESTRIILFGGFEGTDFASPTLHAFYPHQARWCTPSELGSTRGRPPLPRAAHSASAIGRHSMIVFGGRSSAGLLSEALMLHVHRVYQRSGESQTVLVWSRPPTAGGQAPCARAHHAVAAFEQEVFLFGGESIMPASEREQMIATLEAAQKTRMTSSSLFASISAAISADLKSSALMPPLASRDRTDFSATYQIERPGSATLTSMRPSSATATSLSASRGRPMSSAGSRQRSGGATPLRASSAKCRSRAATEVESRGAQSFLANNVYVPPSGRPHSSPRERRGQLSPTDRLMGAELAAYKARSSDPEAVEAVEVDERARQQELAVGSRSARGGFSYSHHPTADLWKLSIDEGGRLCWQQCEPSGPLPFPRSRHVFVAVPQRKCDAKRHRLPLTLHRRAYSPSHP